MKSYKVVVAPVAADKIAEYGRHIAEVAGMPETAEQWVHRVSVGHAVIGQLPGLATQNRPSFRLICEASARGMSSFTSTKLDNSADAGDTLSMATTAKHGTRQIASTVRQRIERGGEQLWRFEDFRDLPFPAVAQALSRLTKTGTIERLSKGLYYRPRPTALGKSRPNPAAISKLASRSKAMFPSGMAAANLLGFTTQNPRRSEIATSELSLPRKLVGADTVIHTRRPTAWARLSETDAALLDFLRHMGRSSELSPNQTVRRTLTLMSEKGRFERLLQAAGTEPPRVRAMLGAIGEQLGKSDKSLRTLRESLNPLSRFDFGMLSGLRCAHNWQAKERRRT